MSKIWGFYFWLFVLFFSVFLLISNGRFGGDGLENYFAAESIVLDGDFLIYDRPFDVHEMRHGEKGDGVSAKGRPPAYGLGMAFILVPFYCFGHFLSLSVSSVPHDYITQFAVSLANPTILALLSLVLFNLLRKLEYSAKVSYAATIIYSICTMNIIYARSGFSEPTIALLVLLAVLSFFNYSKEGKAAHLFLGAFCLGYALFIKKNSIILMPAFTLYFLHLLSSDRTKPAGIKMRYFLFFITPFILSFAALLIQNKAVYGGFLKTEFGTIAGMLSKVRTDGYPVKGLYYYLISSGKGYFIYNIAIALGLFSIKDFFRRHKHFFYLIVLLLLSNLLFYSFIFVRGSLFSWGPRYLFPTLPLFSLFFAEFISKKTTVVRRISVLFFALVGFFVQLPNFIVNFSKYLFFVKKEFKLPEYLINFMPDLSPIKGTWALFASSIKRYLSGVSSDFSFNPDCKLIAPIKASLKGYDVLDIWWLNVIKVEPSLAVPVLLVVCLLVIACMLAFYKVNHCIMRRAQEN